jgi:hypothetical protein
VNDVTNAPTMVISVKADTAGLTRTLRIIAKHFTALADELEQPSGIIKFDGNLSEQDAADIRTRWDAQQP